MKLAPLTVVAGLLVLAPADAFAHPGGGMHGGPPMGTPMNHPAPTARPMGSTNGTGWNHQNGPTHTGQPNVSCGSASAPSTPGNAAAAPGSAFNPDGKAGTVYAGEQPQNSRNTASVSQYDSACAHQP